MVYRVYVEKKPGLRNEADALLRDLRDFLGIQGLTGLRVLNRYDVEGMDEALFRRAVKTVFSEPQLDDVAETLPETAGAVLAVEYLPGQFDQRADSAAQCVQLSFQCEKPTVRTARVYLLEGDLSKGDIARVRDYVINPVESREAALEKPETLAIPYDVPTQVETLAGFRGMDEAAAKRFVADRGLAMDLDDLLVCMDYFRREGRDPTITEVRVLDTYWSDHCRHTTFNTVIDSVHFEDETLQRAYDEYLAVRQELGRTKPVTLMDLGTIAAKYLKHTGQLTKLDESEEINACTVKITAVIDGEKQDWLLLFKNETHNHPTEIEPFGGAATCIGGAIRDPLSGRSYVYAAMRVTGAADVTKGVEDTLPGKLPQRKIAATAAAGYASYGNQIGIATGIVDELYHPGYVAKRMEIGAVLGAAPAKNVRRERPVPGDKVILLGGRTGRDGIGGATGSSKTHNEKSLATMASEVQKGNAPEERKLQRLFRRPEAARLIRRCNDFGAGGVSVAIGELADGLKIDLDKVRRKYEGLDGTELAISESQERMAVVVSAEDAERFCALADEENLEAYVVAEVTAEPRLTMRWNGAVIVDLSRAFLDSNGAEKHVTARSAAADDTALEKDLPSSFREGLRETLGGLGSCSRRGLGERFDSTIGAGTVLMPFGGKNQLTPIQAMVHTLPTEGHTDTCSFMAWGYDPWITEKSPYHGAYLAVVESVAKLIATGASFEDVYLSFQEYFEKLGADPERWGKPLAALLGAFRAQKGLGVAAIGGKDSMSGSFENLHVPPTLVSFAVTTGVTGDAVPNHFKAAGHRVILLRPERDANGLPTAESLKRNFAAVTELLRSGRAVSAYTPGRGGVAEAAAKMSFGDGVGLAFDDGLTLRDLFGCDYGAFLLELAGEDAVGIPLGVTTADGSLSWHGETATHAELLRVWTGTLEGVYPTRTAEAPAEIPAVSCPAETRPAPAVKVARPRVLIPVFPGTNCEYDSAKAFTDAGAEVEIQVLGNLSVDHIARSVERFAAAVRQSQMVFIPGGFSGGDEPDGSGKFITAFFRNDAVKEAVTELLERRDGLMAGICNGFPALIKLGLVPYGRIIDTDENCPTLTFNTIGRHQSRLVRTRVASNRSPWLANTRVGDVYTVPISHGEGKFLASEDLIRTLAENGQIATQYVDFDAEPTLDVDFNPNGSHWAIEGITSPDGRVFGKMGHSERVGAGLYRNVPGTFDIGMFRAAVQYFQ